MSTNILVATSNVKFYTGITTTNNDALIESMIPIIQSDIVNYCKNDFVNSTMYLWDDSFSFTSTNGIVYSGTDTEIDFTDFFIAGSIMKINGSIHNDNFVSLSTVASSYVNTYESISTESSSTGKFITFQKVEYPKDLPFIASKMIKYLLDTQDNSGAKSESIGDYSITYDNVGSNMYPANIINGLKKYRRVGKK